MARFGSRITLPRQRGGFGWELVNLGEDTRHE